MFGKDGRNRVLTHWEKRTGIGLHECNNNVAHLIVDYRASAIRAIPVKAVRSICPELDMQDHRALDLLLVTYAEAATDKAIWYLGVASHLAGFVERDLVLARKISVDLVAQLSGQPKKRGGGIGIVTVCHRAEVADELAGVF